MEGSNNSDVGCGGKSVLVTPCHTPYWKQMLLKSGLRPLNRPLNIDLLPNSDGDNISVVSCESPLSSWDFEPDIPSVDMEEQNEFVGVENTDDGLVWEMDSRSYDELIKKLNEKEEELRVTNLKLHLSEEENIKLKVQVENSEEELNKQKEFLQEEILKLKIRIERSEYQLDNMREELNLKEEELQKQTAKLNTHITEYDCKITNLVEQLEVAGEKIKILTDEIESLRKELGSKSHETRQLQGQLKVAQENMTKSDLELVSERKKNQMLGDLVIMYETNEAIHKQDVQKLNSEMLDLQAKFSREKDELHFDIASLSKMKIQLTSKLEHCESIYKELENKLCKYDTEKLKQEEMCATQQMVLQDGIISLREELGQRMHGVEDVNRESDMVMIERDEVEVKIDKHKVEICSCNDQITNTKTYIREHKASLKEQVMFFISKLDVFKSPNSETCAIFGEAKIEDLSSQLQTEAAQQFRMPNMRSIMAKQEEGAAADGAQPEEEEEVDETGMEAQKIGMVMTQAEVSRSKAVKALKNHKGDIVGAIMELIA